MSQTGSFPPPDDASVPTELSAENQVAAEGAAGQTQEAADEDHTSDPSTVIPCPECRYNLRGLASLRCPECGTPLTIVRDAPQEFLYSAWVSGLAGLIVTATIGMFGLLLALGFSFATTFFGAWTIASIVLIRYWVRSGHSLLLRQYPDVRRTIIAACWLGWLVVMFLGIVLFSL